MKILKSTLSVIALLTLVSHFVLAQEISQDLKSFSKVIVSPKINLILEQGDHENIRLTYSNVSADKINIIVQGNTLRVYPG